MSPQSPRCRRSSPSHRVRVILGRSPSEDTRLLRVARLLPLLIAGFELRYALLRAADLAPELHRTEQAYTHSLTPWIVTLLAFGATFILREAGRGLASRLAPGRRFSAPLGLWLGCSAVFAGVLCGQELLRDLLTLAHSGRPVTLLGSAGWSSIPVAALVGLALAVSLRGARWVLDEVRGIRRRTGPAPSAVVAVPSVGGVLSPLPAPLLAGWSERGPPAVRAPVTA